MQVTSRCLSYRYFTGVSKFSKTRGRGRGRGRADGQGHMAQKERNYILKRVLVKRGVGVGAEVGVYLFFFF